MPSSKWMRTLLLLWIVLTIVNTVRALREPDTREFFAVSLAVLAVPIVVGSIVAVPMLALRRRQARRATEPSIRPSRS